MKAEVWDRSSAQEIDRLSIDTHGVSGLTLMEQAGHCVAKHIRALLKDHPDWQPLFLVGPGNNGGDGLVAARLLHAEQEHLHVFLVGHAPDKISDSTKHQLENLPSKLTPAPFDADFLEPDRAYLVVDGLLGLGVKGSLRPGSFLDALSAVASLPNKHVLAVDLPSGVDADDWSSKPILPADTTVTFGAVKPYHVLAPGRDYCGEVIVEQIDFAKSAIDQVMQRTNTFSIYTYKRFIDSPFDRLPVSAHKYDRGHVLIIGGSDGKVGAPLMSALAALRTGAGWASVAAPTEWLKAYQSLPLSVTFESFFDGENIAAKKLKDFLKERRVASVVIGPGTMRQMLDASLLQVLEQWQSSSGGTVVIDAGCTQDLFPDLNDSGLDSSKTLLTPHPGEWRKMGGNLPPRIDNSEQMSSARTALKSWPATVVYKTATPIVFSQEDAIVSTMSSRWLGKAGSGDMIAGIAAAFGAQGINSAECFLRAVQVLGDAARRCADHRDGNSIIPDDLLAQIGVKDERK